MENSCEEGIVGSIVIKNTEKAHPLGLFHGFQRREIPSTTKYLIPAISTHNRKGYFSFVSRSNNSLWIAMALFYASHTYSDGSTGGLVHGNSPHGMEAEPASLVNTTATISTPTGSRRNDGQRKARTRRPLRRRRHDRRGNRTRWRRSPASRCSRLLAERHRVVADPRVFVYKATITPARTTPPCAGKCRSSWTAATPS